MKNMLKIAGMLIIILSATQYADAQKGMRGFRNDSTFMSQRHDSAFMKMNKMRMAHHMMMGYGRPGMMNAGSCCGRCMNPGMMRGRMQHGFNGQMMAHQGGNFMMFNAPGRKIMDSMPGVTAKQKEELAKLNENQKNEMKKLMEKHFEAVKALREEHKKNVMNLLTDEQKKWLEESSPKANPK